MRILVTGARGLVGSQVVRDLESAEHAVVSFDRESGQDVLDLPNLQVATRGCDAVVHAAALFGRPGESAAEIREVNVVGTENMLAAAGEDGVERIVNLSSVDVLGVFKGERAPDYLPLDDAHSCYPSTPYARSKLQAEELCQRAAEATGLCVISLRPPGVWDDSTYRFIEAERAKRPEFEWDPYWEYGAFIDVRDLSAACLRGLTCEAEGHHRLLVAAPDITTSGRASRDLTELLHPDVEWRGGPEYDEDPFLSLIDSRPAMSLLGWTPVHTWRGRAARFRRAKR